jgi:two-component system response regulator AtoC
MVALSGGGELGVDALPDAAGAVPVLPDAPAAASPPGAPGGLTLRAQLDDLERSVIARTMTAVRGNQSEAARRLGISRNTLTERLRRYAIAAEFGEGNGAG